MRATVPIVLCFDLEPDERKPLPRPGRKVAWAGVEETVRLAESYRDRLAEATGAPVAYNWFLRMDPAIQELHGEPTWLADRFGSLLADLRSRGDSIGLHTHCHRWDRRLDDWVVDHGSEEWVGHCLDTAFDAFNRAFGEPCSLNRIGDWFMSDAAMARVERLGAQIDLTINAGQKRIVTNVPAHPHTGSLPDYSRARRGPYHPSRADFRRAAASAADGYDLWEIPILGVDIRPATSLPRRLMRFLRYPGRPPYRLWPLWSLHDPDLFWDMIEADLPHMDPPCLTFATRSHTALTPQGKAAVSRKLEGLLGRRLAGELRFTTPFGALALLNLDERPAAQGAVPVQ